LRKLSAQKQLSPKAQVVDTLMNLHEREEHVRKINQHGQSLVFKHNRITDSKVYTLRLEKRVSTVARPKKSGLEGSR
jgi:hypothetical protein